VAITFIRSASSALIGFSAPEQVADAVAYAGRGPLDPEFSVWLARRVLDE
jgi:hypothetical protein